jgi:nitroreductase
VPVEEPAIEELHPLLAARRSPSSFDPARPVSPGQLGALLEAARWAPSAGNSQPWAFIAGLRGDETHGRLLAHLTGSSARWAPAAGLLLANLGHVHVEETDWDYSEFSIYDLGQAVAHMTLQAQAMGLAVRQFRAFDRDALAAEFDVPEHWQVTLMSAIGYPGADGEPAKAGRERRTIEQLLWPAAGEAPR